MTVIAYTNNSEINRVGKSLTQVASYTGSLKGACDVLSPVITLQLNAVPTNVNYMYVEEFSRYYFVTGWTVEITGLVTVSLSVDVLETYKELIKATRAIIERQEKKYNVYLPDGAFRAEQKTQSQIVAFPQGFSKSSSILLHVI